MSSPLKNQPISVYGLAEQIRESLDDSVQVG